MWAADQWWYTTKADVHVVLAEWEAAEQPLRAYRDDAKTTPFMLATTLRQFRDLWTIQRARQGQRLLHMLEASLITRPTRGAPADERPLSRTKWFNALEGAGACAWAGIAGLAGTERPLTRVARERGSCHARPVHLI